MRASIAVTVWMLAALSPRLSSAQSVYAGAGLGPTVVLDVPAGSRSTYSNVYGVLGWQSRRSLGVRLEGAETYSRLWFSLDLTYRFEPSASTLRPFAFAGPGFAIDLSNADPLVNVGAGLWWSAWRPLSVFAECRLQHLLSVHPQIAAPRHIPGQTLLPITFGLVVGS